MVSILLAYLCVDTPLRIQHTRALPFVAIAQKGGGEYGMF